MRDRRGTTRLTIQRLGSLAVLGALAALLVLLAAACGEEPTGAEGSSQGEGAGTAITVYSSPT